MSAFDRRDHGPDCRLSQTRPSVLQWWVLGVLPIWQKFAPPPFWFVQLTTTFTNLGGCLNLLVYARIRRRKPPTPPVAIVERPFQDSRRSSGGP